MVKVLKNAFAIVTAPFHIPCLMLFALLLIVSALVAPFTEDRNG